MKHTTTMATQRLRPSSLLRYSTYALFFGLAATVCAESMLKKDPSLLTLDEIEENVQVPTQPPLLYISPCNY